MDGRGGPIPTANPNPVNVPIPRRQHNRFTTGANALVAAIPVIAASRRSRRAGTNLLHVVRLNYYTTDVDGLLGAWHLIAERLSEASCRPTSTLLGLARLAFPDMLIEIEATALVQ